MLSKLMRTGLRWLWLAVIVLALDRFSKLMALHFLTEYEPLRITSFFNLTLAYNKGAAFSFLGYASGWQVWLFGLLAIVVSGVLLEWLRRLSYQNRLVSVALSLVIGGALGNLWDRIYYGKVIDLIQLHIANFYWPVFNVADSAICVGAFLLIWDAFRNRKK